MLIDRLRRLVKDNGQRLAKLTARLPKAADRIAAFRQDPAAMFPQADPWQRDLLRSDADRILMLTSRQCGKSTTAGYMALKEGLLNPGSTTLLVSPSLRQSSELFRRTMDAFNATGRPIGIRSESALRVEFSNGSRVISLPASEATVRGYTSSLVIFDEAARIVDSMYFAMRPMLATTNGRCVCLSTAFAKSGFFHDAWTGQEKWERIRITASMCPRISKEFLAEELAALGRRWYAMEYDCEFGDNVAAFFATDDIKRAMTADCRPLFTQAVHSDGPSDPTVIPLFR